MDDTSSNTVAARPGVGRLDVALSILIAFNLAVSQPLLDLLGRNAEFFVARSAPVGDIIVLVLGLVLGLPLLGALIVVLVRKIHRRTGDGLHLIGLTGLFGLLVLRILKRAPGPGVLLIIVATVAGAAIAVAYARAPVFRTIMRWTAPLPLVVAGIALFGSQLSKLVVAGGAVPAGVPGVVIRNPAPVVFLTFDEFPIASLMDDRYQIDARLYPNFAKLAREATWFRNATGVGEFTDKATPAIMTGNFPDNTKLPIVGDHPRNIFTLLGRSYEVRAQEPITRLCPVQACGRNAPRVSTGKRWRSLLSDLRVITLHVMLPEDLTENLPPINRGWGNFSAQAHGGLARKYTQKDRAEALRANFHAAVNQDRRAAFEAFVASIKRTERPALYFTHTILPHGPWEFLRSGHNYPLPRGAPGGTRGNTWSDDLWLTTQAYQHHLLQTEYVDTLVGDVVAKLQSEGLYDRALIVITADHGGSFTPGRSRRSIASDTIGEIAPVPFIVKRPGRHRGAIDDRPVYTMDVLPTIADVLGVANMWQTDGVSAFRVDPSTRPQKRFNNNKGRIITFPATEEMLKGVVKRKYELFARVGRSIDPWRTRPYGDLLGRSVGSLNVASGSGGSGGSIARPRKEDGGAPVVVTGSLGGGGNRFLALAVDGVIRGITRSEGDAFGFLLPEGAISHDSRLELFLIESGGSRVRRLAGTTAAY